MAGVQLIAEIEPKNSGSFALLDDKYMRGGLRVVETYDELESIPSDRLKDGCLAMVTTPSRVLYVYDQANDAWSPFSSGGGGGGSDWLCVEDGETTKLVKDVDTWTQKIVVINHIRTYVDYFALPTEYVQNNEVAYCKADSSAGTTTYKKGLYSYDAEKASWIEVNSTIEIDSALSETSKRPVQNRVVTKALEEKVSKDDVDNVISRFSENPIQNKAVALALENIKPGKTMTAEEYEALDDETKNDDSFYYISDTGEIYQNEIIYGGKQIFDVTQEEYDALTDEEKSNNEYHCTDTGRTYINGILYGDKKPIELTYEEYKQLEADGLVEPDVDYIIVGNESGVLLTSTDVAYSDTLTVKDKFDDVDSKIDEVDESVNELNDKISKHSLPLLYDSGVRGNSSVEICKISNVLKTASGGSDPNNLNLLLSTRGGDEVEIAGGKNDSSWFVQAKRNLSSITPKISSLYRDGLDLYIRLELYFNFLRIYHKSGVLPDDFKVEIVSSIPDTATEIVIKDGSIDDEKTSTTSTWSSSKIVNYLNSPRYTRLISGNATVDTGWSLEQGESRKFGRLLQLDGHEGQGALSYSFIVFVKANFNNATKVICKQIVGMYEDYDMEYTRFFELGISANKTLTIKNKSAVQTSYKFI